MTAATAGGVKVALKWHYASDPPAPRNARQGPVPCWTTDVVTCPPRSWWTAMACHAAGRAGQPSARARLGSLTCPTAPWTGGRPGPEAQGAGLHQRRQDLPLQNQRAGV